jgi:primosomal protein N' (replication factor Y)
MDIFDSNYPLKYVDVILPLALPKVLTYFVPPELEDEIGIGQRVVVQLQKEKLYTGIISRISTEKPEYDTKPILALLDKEPIVHGSDLKFWEWIAQYYMCTLGEVMTAALPSGLKLNSESKIILGDIEGLNHDVLTDREYLVVEALEMRPFLTMEDVQHVLGIKTVQTILKSLVDKGFIVVEQELKYKYKPKFETYIELSDHADREENLKILFDELVKAPKQLEALMLFIHLTSRYTDKIRQIKKQSMMEDGRINTAAIKELVKKGIFVEKRLETGRFANEQVNLQEQKELSAEQKRALGEVSTHFADKDVVLIHGVTSSGKTEVYVKLIEEAVKKGKQVLFLLPEIALTTQLIQRVSFYFPGMVGVYHSKFNENERVEVWNKVLKFDPGKGIQPFQIIMGARSSLFLPYSHLGLVIVDEEHDPSYKQYDPAPRYHARDAAIYLASAHQAKVVLGSATPSAESNYNATKGKYGLVHMLKRFGDVQMPSIVPVDLKRAYRDKRMDGHFSVDLVDEIKAALEKREQVILFQNRRGFSVIVQCNACGHVPNCKNCDITLTYHKNSDQLRCHYCGYQVPMMKTCIKCKSTEISTKGFGTEKIEEELEKIIPEAKVGRLDFDTTRKKHSYVEILQDFADGNIDILVGTQMVTKGLDFDNVSLVGILNADNMLHYPDFRANERAFQLMIQVSGRAGRRNKQGKVIIQTYDPEHKTIQQVLSNDYSTMYADEVTERQVYKYPPYYRLIDISIRNRDFNETRLVAKELAFRLKEKLGDRVLGPEIPTIGRIKNYFIFNILIKADKNVQLAGLKDFVRANIHELQMTKEGRRTSFNVDVDPY